MAGHAALPPGDDSRVDDLRQRLRALGYLDAGVDRFVLAPARASRRPATIALLASLRVGSLAAILLGPAAALGLSARVPGLITGSRDALVVALYLAVFFGAVVTVAAFGASLLTAALARRAGGEFAGRGRLLSRLAGGGVAAISLGYLTLWWHTVIAGIGWSAPFWTISALAIAVAISLLLGHAIAVAASAVILADARGPRAGAEPSTPIATSWRATLASAAIAFGAAALLLTWSARFEASPAPTRQPLTVVGSGVRVRVIGIDGFDIRIFERLVSQGRVPALARALGGGRVSLDSGTDAGDPARVWTTIATGQPTEVHGVQGLETRRVAGVQGRVTLERGSALGRALRGATDLVRLTRPAIASGAERRAKTFWEVAADAGLRTAVVNWWATWPALESAGTVLSDRATLRLERGGPLDAEIAPQALYAALQQRWPELRAAARTAAAKVVNDTVQEPTRTVLRRSAELDALQLALLAAVTSSPPDLSAVYLPGLDIAQRALLAGDQPGMAASVLASRLDALEAYYIALDALLEPVIDPSSASASDVIVVVTEPGRVSDLSGARLSVRGANIRTSVDGNAAATAVAPTILYALGLPIARDLANGPSLELFDPEYAARYPIRYVSTYGVPMPASSETREGKPLDEEMVDRLRSLGYVR